MPYKNAPTYNHPHNGATKELDHSTVRSHEQQFLRRKQPSSSEARMIDGWGGRIRVPEEHFAYMLLKISLIFNVLCTLTYNEIYRKEIRQLYKFPWSISQFPKEPTSPIRTEALNQTPFSSEFRHFLYRKHSEHSRTGLSFALSPTMAWTVLRLRVKQTASRYERQLLTHRTRTGGQLTWGGPPVRRLGKGPTTPRRRKPACYRTFQRTPDCTTYALDNAHTI